MNFQQLFESAAFPLQTPENNLKPLELLLKADWGLSINDQ